VYAQAFQKRRFIITNQNVHMIPSRHKMGLPLVRGSPIVTFYNPIRQISSSAFK
jgi:hypothetical protein